MNLLNYLDALLITDPINIRYLTGFVGSSETEREGYVLVTTNQVYFFTNSLYKELAQSLNTIPGILGFPESTQLHILELTREKPLSAHLRELLKSGQKLGFETENLRVAEYIRLSEVLSDVRLVATSGRVEAMRMIKRPEEIAKIKKAAKLTDKCFTFIQTKIKPGISETDLAWEIESFIRKNGGELAFPPIVAFNEHSSQPHYLPTHNSQLTAQNLILLDFGAKVDGYCSDMTRVVFLGKPKKEWIHAYSAVLASQQAALEALPNSTSGMALDTRSRERIEKAGLPPCPHTLGHGVGLAIHESPRLSHKADETIQPGTVFTIEPGVYIPGAYGIRIEDLVLLTKDGIEIISKSSKEIIIL